MADDFDKGWDEATGAVVPNWGRKNPNLYGVYGAGKAVAESIPYARYLFPENRQEFMGKNTQGQTNELLKETLNAELLAAAQPISKAAVGLVKSIRTPATPRNYGLGVLPTQPVKGFQNVVHERPAIQIGQPKVGDHIAEKGYTYRSISKAELDAAREAKEFLAPIKSKGGRANVKHWDLGGGGRFYNNASAANGNQIIIRVPNGKMKADVPVKFNDAEIVNLNEQVPWYHGSNVTDGPLKATEVDRPFVFASKNRDVADFFANEYRTGGAPNVKEVNLNVKNTFDYRNKDHINSIVSDIVNNPKKWGFKNEFERNGLVAELRAGEFSAIESPKVTQWIKNNGFDSFNVRENIVTKAGKKINDVTTAVFDPQQILPYK